MWMVVGLVAPVPVIVVTVTWWTLMVAEGLSVCCAGTGAWRVACPPPLYFDAHVRILLISSRLSEPDKQS